jgi:putative FmdB family regulatory protein
MQTELTAPPGMLSAEHPHKARPAPRRIAVPTYIYECGKCHHCFSLVRSSDDRNLAASCPKCSTETRKRVFTAPIIIKSADSPRRPEIPAVKRQRGGGTFTNCTAEGNGQGGFAFRGSGHHVMYNTRTIGNPVAFDIGDNVEVEDYNTTIE